MDMKTGRSLKTWVSILLVTGILTGYTVQGFGNSTASDPPVTSSPGMIIINTMKMFKKLERPAVVFLHDQHTRALEISPNDCATCHPMTDNRLSLYFKRTDILEGNALMDLYHLECIKCHNDKADQGKKSGPAECGGCHRKDAETVSARTPMAFDKSLHFRHTEARKNKCEQCHHEYDADTKKLFYAKGKEGSCRYCHKAQDEENRMSMAKASHMQCISCHRETLSQNKDAGPVECHGCHDIAAQQKIKKIADPPRIDRNQPDAVFVKKLSPGQDPAQMKENRMFPVPFNHKVHEAGNDTCAGCHHNSMEACTACHPVGGIEKGNFVGLEQAMHQPDTGVSCNGCHAARQKDITCAGCHAPIQNKGPGKGTASSEKCNTCHIKPPEGMAMNAETAAALLSDRPFLTQTIKDEDVPEKVTIKALSKTYEPVVMPHRQIVYALSENIKDNRLAMAFHKSNETICRGCHHNSPPSLKPPHCGTCHGEPFDQREMNKPGLMGAYHIQCMECHKAMDIKKPVGCTECHKKKNDKENMITRKTESP